MSVNEPQLRRRMMGQARLREQDYQGGYVPAKLFADSPNITDDDGHRCDGDTHTERLLGELVEWGLLEIARDPHHQAGTSREFRHRRYKITPKGWMLWMGDIPPIPGVADDRLEGK